MMKLKDFWFALGIAKTTEDWTLNVTAITLVMMVTGGNVFSLGSSRMNESFSFFVLIYV